MMFYTNKTRYHKDKNDNNNNHKTINSPNSNNNSSHHHHNCGENGPAQKEKAANSKKYKRAKVKVKVPNFTSAFESSSSSSRSSSRNISAAATTTTERSRRRPAGGAHRTSSSASAAASVPAAAFSACGAFGLSLCALLLLRLASAATGLAVGVDTTNANITDLGSPASAYQGDPFIPHGAKHVYKLLNVVSIEDLRQPGVEETSYTLQSYLTITSVWHNHAEQLLHFKFSDPTVSAPGKFGGQKPGQKRVTQEAKIPDRPFYISLMSGKPTKVVAHQSRDQSLLNLERGIASLFQVQFSNGPVLETDVSDKCQSFYSLKSHTHVTKYKTDCSNWDLRVNYRTERPFSLSQRSREQVVFELTEGEGTLLNVESTETHRVFLEAKHDVGSEVKSRFSLTFVEALDESVNQLPENTLDEVFKKLMDQFRVFELEADVDGALSQIKDITLKQKIATTAQQLTDNHIGRESLALTFAELLPLARITKQSEFVEILEAHRELHAQLVDLLAAAQTADAHNAIHAVFKYENNSDADLLEKYLQSLAVGTHPERAIIKDLFKRLQRDTDEERIKNEKLHDSVMQTVAALTRQSGFNPEDKLLNKVRTFILQQLNEKCNETSCKTVYIRALQNLQDISTIPTLVEYAVEGEVAVSVAAMQALKSFPSIRFNEKHRKLFEQIFYQSKRMYDSSARTLALDILLELKLTKPQLGKLLDYLTSADRHFEIKTYVIQKLRVLAEKCSRFAAMLRACLAERPEVNNYHIIGQKGLTTVLSRELSQEPAFNESLLSVQEIYQGVLKRGSVELMLSAGPDAISTFKIGMYTKGLSSFVGDSNKVEEDEEDEAPATAGMEISVQGVLLRPLVFFTGQSELMGHVWSGSASEPTPAFQATTVAQDHEHYVILSSGATMYMRVIGARSVDLNGKVEMSLWNRNANTEIEQNSGDAIVGLMVAGSSYAKVENYFTVTSEPTIRLQADIDFYSGMKLCMQLQRPEMLLKHSNTKSVHLTATKPYAKHIRTKFTHKYPGHTLALNQKNNEMCNIIFGA